MNNFENYFNIFNVFENKIYNFKNTILDKYMTPKNEYIILLLWSSNKKRKLLLFISYFICELILKNKIKQLTNDSELTDKIFSILIKFIVKTKVIDFNKNGDDIRKFIIEKINNLRNLYFKTNDKITLEILLNDIEIILKIESDEKWNKVDFINNLNTSYLSDEELKVILWFLEVHFQNNNDDKINEIIEKMNLKIKYIIPKEPESKEFKKGYNYEEWEEVKNINANKIGNLFLVNSKNVTKENDITFSEWKYKWENVNLKLYSNVDENIDVKSKSKWRIKDIENRTESTIEYIKKIF